MFFNTDLWAVALSYCQMDNEHCMLLALPCGRDHMDVLQQSNNLQTGFITYLQQKQAAGIVNIAAPGSQQAAYVVHIFPSCDFANENLARIAPDLLHRVADIAHLLIIIATVWRTPNTKGVSIHMWRECFILCATEVSLFTLISDRREDKHIHDDYRPLECDTI